MSISAIREPASGASRIVAGPRTVIAQPAGAMNVAPSTVVRGVSAVSRSTFAAAGRGAGFFATGGAAGVTGALGAAGGVASWHATRRRRVQKARICTPYSDLGAGG